MESFDLAHGCRAAFGDGASAAVIFPCRHGEKWQQLGASPLPAP